MTTATGLNSSVALSNGVQIPVMGLGVWRAESGEETYNAVRWALEAGYRAIDTATIYKNETDVGRAFRDSGKSRSEIFFTSKVWHSSQGYEGTLRAFDESLQKLGMDYLDLYLIHHYMPEKSADTWRAMEKLYHDGRIRAIGVSNFHERQMTALLKTAEVCPMLNQIELHPYLQQRDAKDNNDKLGIVTESWAPIAKGKALTEPCIVAFSETYHKTPAQIVLRWGLQKGLVLIPKSVHKERILENMDIFDFALDEEAMQTIDALERNQRFGIDPNDSSWMANWVD